MAANSPYAIFISGQYTTTVYKPTSGDVAAGNVVETGTNIGAAIAFRKIANNEVGALAVDGGIWEGYADGALAVGATVHWDATNNYVTATTTSNPLLGRVVTRTTAADEKVRFLLAK